MKYCKNRKKNRILIRKAPIRSKLKMKIVNYLKELQNLSKKNI